MIIWRGLGILVVLAGIGGLLLGAFLGNALGMGAYSMALGMLVAALLNFGLCKLLYRSPGARASSHSLFFIPAKAFTVIFAILILPSIFIGVVGKAHDAKLAATPGYKSFKAADDLIDMRKDATVHGNTPDAKTAAGLFSTMMQDIQKEAFTGGSKRNAMTGGEFLTYCQHGKEAIVFLCHVPELRNYKTQDVKDGLTQIAWATAKAAALKLDPEKKKKVVVGLRGIANYGFIMSGSPADEKPLLAKNDSEDEVIYPHFADPQETPPAKPAS